MSTKDKYPYPYFYSDKITVVTTTTGNVSIPAMGGLLAYINVEATAYTAGDTITAQVRKGQTVKQMIIEKARLRGATRSHEFDFSEKPVLTKAGDMLYFQWDGTSNSLTVEITLGYYLPQPTRA